MSGHDHCEHSGTNLFDAARDALVAAGEQWTEMRSDIFEALARRPKPASAYDIAEDVSTLRGKVEFDSGHEGRELEVLAHLPKPLRNAAFALHRVEFDETELETLGADTLPGDWTQFPPAAGTQEAGRRWLERGERAVLAVPSVLLPEERNFVFNPRHPAFAQLRPHRERLFFFDPRLG